MNDSADDYPGRDGKKNSDKGIHAQKGKQEVVHEGPQDDELPVGQVHDIHNPPDQGEAKGRQAVDAPDEDTVDDGLDKQYHGLRAPIRIITTVRET